MQMNKAGTTKAIFNFDTPESPEPATHRGAMTMTGFLLERKRGSKTSREERKSV